MKAKPIIITVAVAGTIVALYFLVTRKNTLSNTGASYQLPGGTGATPSGVVNPASSLQQVYTNAANVILRTSACTNDPTFMIFGGNVGLTIPNAATYVGTVINTAIDTNGDINPATSMVYNWYQIALSSAMATNFSIAAGTTFFIREDFCTIH